MNSLNDRPHAGVYQKLTRLQELNEAGRIYLKEMQIDM